MALVRVIGVYPVPEAEQPCHLIEVEVADFTGAVDVGEFTQPLAGRDESHWQVPFGEVVLDGDGCNGNEPIVPDPIKVNDNLRLAFFFYYLKPSTLMSQFGPLALPPVSARPDRLSFINYEPPC